MRCLLVVLLQHEHLFDRHELMAIFTKGDNPMITFPLPKWRFQIFIWRSHRKARFFCRTTCPLKVTQDLT